MHRLERADVAVLLAHHLEALRIRIERVHRAELRRAGTAEAELAQVPAAHAEDPRCIHARDHRIDRLRDPIAARADPARHTGELRRVLEDRLAHAGGHPALAVGQAAEDEVHRHGVTRMPGARAARERILIEQAEQWMALPARRARAGGTEAMEQVVECGLRGPAGVKAEQRFIEEVLDLLARIQAVQRGCPHAPSLSRQRLPDREARATTT
jgi:hypothetical protein